MSHDRSRRWVATDYKVACICPMGVELAPVEGMLDTIHDPLPTYREQNAYTLGSIGKHNIVIAIMPEIGNNAAATTITQLCNDFPAIHFGLLVGIGGGVPGEKDIRLGDVVVGQPTGEFPGVVQYDIGKELEGGQFQRTGSLNKPPTILSANVRKLESQHRRLGHNLLALISDMFEKYPRMRSGYSPPNTIDQLYMTTYKHQSDFSCDQCDPQYVVTRPTRVDSEPIIFYGTIGSANKVIKDAELRDRIRRDTHALCVEMEAAGLMSNFPCLVIRGICDYADSHKNEEWQPFAAAVAAAYMKELLLILPAQDVHSIGNQGYSHMIDSRPRLPAPGGVTVDIRQDPSRMLRAASESGEEQVVRSLVNAGADIEARGDTGTNPLILATQGSHENIIRLLIGAGANVNAKGGLHSDALRTASHNGNTRIVQLLLKAGADVDAGEGYEPTALLIAARHGYDRIVQLLIEAGANVNVQSSDLCSPLQAASAGGHHAVVQLLLGAGARINGLNDTDVNPFEIYCRQFNNDRLSIPSFAVTTQQRRPDQDLDAFGSTIGSMQHDKHAVPASLKHFCPIPSCGRSYVRLEHLKSHVRIHTEERRWVCPQCNKVFTGAFNLSRHREMHGHE